MNNNPILGISHCMVPVPRTFWEMQVSKTARKMEAGLRFMSAEHHQIRNFVVRELPRVGKPVSPEFIGQNLNLPLIQVNAVLDDLEKHKAFLFRNEQGAVIWAYPVTVDKTPHRVTLSTGEQVYAA